MDNGERYLLFRYEKVALITDYWVGKVARRL